MKEIKIGLLGFGNIGSGFVRLLHANGDLITRRLGARPVLKWIADIDSERVKKSSPIQSKVTRDAREVINDPELDIIVELIGGLEPAKSFVIDSLRAGKAVVTANKALIATHGDEIFQLAAAKGANIAYEAAVGGTIPIIKTLKESFAANNFRFIMAIVNGTSNFILSKMTDENKSFTQVLKEAQDLGFAEADPTYDVEGIDAAHKLAILLSLAYDIKVDLQSIYREGISGITPLDIDFARELGYRIKLLAIARKQDKTIEARIHPAMVKRDHLLANVNGNFNAFHLYGDAAESVFLYGQGSGMMPTASAVMGDVIDLCRDRLAGIACRVPARASAEGTLTRGSLRPMEDLVTNYYIRFSAIDRPGVLSKISGILGENDISLATVIQKGRTAGEPVPVVMISHRAREANVRAALERIDQLDVVTAKTVFIRMEDEIL